MGIWLTYVYSTLYSLCMLHFALRIKVIKGGRHNMYRRRKPNINSRELSIIAPGEPHWHGRWAGDGQTSSGVVRTGLHNCPPPGKENPRGVQDKSLYFLFKTSGSSPVRCIMGRCAPPTHCSFIAPLVIACNRLTLHINASRQDYTKKIKEKSQFGVKSASLSSTMQLQGTVNFNVS
jgi:hypothetical protein